MNSNRQAPTAPELLGYRLGQTPITRETFGVWKFEFLWCLGFGVRSFLDEVSLKSLRLTKDD